MSTAPPIVHLALGPAEHGVVRHALELADAAEEPVVQLVSTPGPAQVLERLAAVAPGRFRVHLHVTDRLCGTTPDRAAELVEAVSARYDLSITLHDLPQPSDGPEGFVRRRRAYRRMAGAARQVLVSSRHELALLQQFSPQTRAQVLPLPVPTRRRRPGSGAVGGRPARATVGILGYLYPGKGHAEVLDALDHTHHDDVRLVALGRPSDGHDWLVPDLRLRAGARRLEITGYLDDVDLDRRIAEITVPVVAPTHVSASGSLHRWIGCGRRPVTLASTYTVEVEQHLPGSLLLTDDLPTAIDHALRHPETTWLDDDHHPWDIGAAAAAQTAVLLQDRP